MTKDYKDALLSSEELFKKLYDITNKYENVKILNYYDSKEFPDKEFYDGDHVNKIGAEKLTAMIRKSIN